MLTNFARGEYSENIIYFFFFFLTYIDVASSDEDLLNIVITPTRFEQKISNTNSFVTVITEEEIKNSSASSLLDVLNNQSSLGIATTGGAGSVAS